MLAMIGIGSGPRESLTAALLRKQQEGELPDAGTVLDSQAREAHNLLITAGLKPPSRSSGPEADGRPRTGSRGSQPSGDAASDVFSKISPRLRSKAQLDARARLRAELQAKAAGLRAAQALRVAQLTSQLEGKQNLRRPEGVTEKLPDSSSGLREAEVQGREGTGAQGGSTEEYVERVRAQVREGLAAQEARLAAERESARLLEEATLRHQEEKKALEKAAREQLRKAREREAALRAAMFERTRQRLALMRCLALWRARCKTYEAMGCVAQKLWRKRCMQRGWLALKGECEQRGKQRLEEAERVREEQRALALRRAELCYACNLARRALLSLLAVHRVRAAAAAAQETRNLRMSKIDALCMSLDEVARRDAAQARDAGEAEAKAATGASDVPEATEPSGTTTAPTVAVSEPPRGSPMQVPDSTPKEPGHEQQTPESNVGTAILEQTNDPVPRGANPKPYKPPPVNRRQLELEERVNRRKQQKIEALEAARRKKEEAEAKEAARARKLREELREATKWQAARTLRRAFTALRFKYASYSSNAPRAEAFRSEALLRSSLKGLQDALREKFMRRYGTKVDMETREQRIGLLSDRLTLSLYLRQWHRILEVQRCNQQTADLAFQRMAFSALQKALQTREEEEAERGRTLRPKVLGRAVIRVWLENARAQKRETAAIARRRRLVDRVLDRCSAEWEERMEEKFMQIFEDLYSRALPRLRPWNEVLALAGLSQRVVDGASARRMASSPVLATEKAPLGLSDLAS